jgi:hypothetical protein
MKTFKGPYYTLQEACKKLDWNKSELLHAIENKKIVPVIFSNHVQLMSITPSEDGSWKGHAVIKYRGHIHVEKQTYMALLDGHKKHLGPSLGLMVDEQGISHISTTYPLDVDLPVGQLHAWSPSSSHLMDKFVVNLPVAAGDTLKMMEYLGATLGSPKPDQTITAPTKTLLNFASKKPYTSENLRIPNSEVLKIGTPTIIQKEQIKATPRDTSTLKHTRQIHEVFERLLRAHPDITAKKGWRLLRDDHDLEDPSLDLDNIISAMDSNEIMWTSKNRVEQTFTSISFGPQLSRIRQKIMDET